MNDELKVIISAEIGELKSACDEAKNDISEVAGASEDAEKKFKVNWKAIGAAVAAGVAAVGAAAVKLSKAVLDSYADYEQLTGGIETLFKDSSDTVMGYAENAYKTAGLSANQYMETVTGFSASLLQSLGGDTEKAAEYANMAVTDMADNANKMGSSMESIQNAYQGFAKQNYTMLDNLKLGYGGTKEEMQRLLEDAEKISGFKYDISSYSDIVDAIHIVQTEMGITGTTQLEAEKTISGSINTLKGAWANFVTGLGDANADIGQLTQNVIDSFVNVFNNVKPILENIVAALPSVISSLNTALIDLAPTLLDSVVTLFNSILTGIIDLLPQLMPVVINAVLMCVGCIIDNIPAFVDALIQIVVALIQGISDNLPQILSAVIEAVIQVTIALLDNLPLLLDTFLELMLSAVDAIIQAIPHIVAALPKIIEALVTFLISNIPMLVDTGIKLFVSIVKELPTIIKSIVAAIPKIITAIVKGIASGVSQMAEAGKNLCKGLWQGLSNSVEWIKSKIRGWVGNITSFLKRLFGIASPSKVFAGYGKFLTMGLGEGMTKSINYATRAVEETAAAMESAFTPDLIAETQIESSDLEGGLNYNYSGAFEKSANSQDSIVDKIFNRLAENSTPIILQVDGKTFAQTSIKTINELTKQTGSLGLVIA